MRKREKFKNRLYLIARLISVLLILSSVFGLIFGEESVEESRYVFIIAQGLFMLSVSFIPSIAERIWKIELPIYVEVIFLLFCSCAIILGEIFEFYILYEWWDDVLHTINGVFVAVLGFVIINIWNERTNIKMNMSPLFVVIFVFCLSETSAIIWELFEWSVDTIFGTNMQRFKDNLTSEPFLGRDALRDTISDLALNTLGALITCIIGYFGMVKEKKEIIEELEDLKTNETPLTKKV